MYSAFSNRPLYDIVAAYRRLSREVTSTGRQEDMPDRLAKSRMNYFHSGAFWPGTNGSIEIPINIKDPQVCLSNMDEYYRSGHLAKPHPRSAHAKYDKAKKNSPVVVHPIPEVPSMFEISSDWANSPMVQTLRRWQIAWSSSWACRPQQRPSGRSSFRVAEVRGTRSRFFCRSHRLCIVTQPGIERERYFAGFTD